MEGNGMSKLVPARGGAAAPPRPTPGAFDEPTGPGQFSPNPVERAIGALRQHKWLALGVFVLFVVGGVVAIRFVKPQYEVQATIWVQSETPSENGVGPIRSRELLNSNAWVELLRSYRISDEVVRKLALYIQPEKEADAPIFRGFSPAGRFAVGEYSLHLDGDKRTWALKNGAGREVDRGAAADSVGRALGFQWVLPPEAFVRGSSRTVGFTVATPRETSIRLMERFDPRLTAGSNFLKIRYYGRDPHLAARTLNTWTAEYVTVAASLKKRNLVEFASILEEQLDFAQKALVGAERSLEGFRVNTITLPTEGGPVAAGVEMSRQPALTSYFNSKIEYDNLKHDREAVERTIRGASTGNMPYEGMLLIPSVAQSPGTEALREAFRQQYQLKAELASNQQVYTNEHQIIRDLTAKLDVIQKQTIPSLANQLLQQLKDRERDYESRIAGASREMQAVPPRTIEEMRLRRAVVVAEGLYTTLKGRFAEAKLAEASATPDVSVLDSAVAPLKPTKNTTPVIIAMAILGGLGAAVGLAVLLDKLDKRFRYPEQATQDLGLQVAGVVPRLPKRGLDSRSPEQVMQLVESFRSLRMHVIHSVPNPVMLAVSSAGPGDGKSLVSANLALSLAEAGLRTVLIDGDTRRGALHRMFAVEPKAGFTEYLLGRATAEEIVLPTSHEHLSLIAAGARHPRTPELLTSDRLRQLVDTLRSSYDAVVFDTPPFAAGIDAYAISAAAGNLLVVVRVGHTERRLAAAKVSVVERLPVNVIGTVLNNVALEGEFQYYGYAAGYGSGEPDALLTSTT
jgi:capsular exopolysaccharide synthesis family protein